MKVIMPLLVRWGQFYPPKMFVYFKATCFFVLFVNRVTSLPRLCRLIINFACYFEDKDLVECCCCCCELFVSWVLRMSVAVFKHVSVAASSTVGDNWLQFVLRCQIATHWRTVVWKTLDQDTNNYCLSITIHSFRRQCVSEMRACFCKDKCAKIYCAMFIFQRLWSMNYQNSTVDIFVEFC